MKIDPLLRQKVNNNKQRKLANIRVRNFMNAKYLAMKVAGEIQDFKVVGVKIVNRVQSVGLRVVPIVCADNIEVNIGFTNEVLAELVNAAKDPEQ